MAAPPRSKDGSPVPLSGSVEAVRQRRGEVGAVEVARSLWNDHPRYVARDAALRALDHVAEGSASRSWAEWVDRVAALVDARALADIPAPDKRLLHGQLLIYGLTRYDPELHRILSGAGILDELRRAITPDPEKLLGPGPAPERPAAPAQDVKLVADTPATQDLLDREGFASSLATLIDSQRRDPTDVVSGPILTHLYGAWGSGKTSLYWLVRRCLESPPEHLGLPDAGWLCVTFNAWGHQRTAPPWWWLMDRVYREAQSGRRAAPLVPLPWHRRVRLWFWWWSVALLALVAAGALVLMAVLVSGAVTIDALADVSDKVDVVVGFFIAAGSAVTLVRSSKASLLVGSPRSASAFLRSGGDPYRRISARYRKLVDRVGRNVLVFIDDLDRCQPEYVVELLEGVQTIFSDAAVTYLVAADREWVSESYQKVYSDLAPAMDRPGRPLGYLFLEKTFAVSASLPRPSWAAQQRYWHAVLGGAAVEMESISDDDRARAADELAGVGVDTAVEQAANLGRTDLSGHARAVRERAAIKLARQVASGGQDHVLAPYLPLLDLNPRALKRLRNAYAIAAVGRFASLDISTAAQVTDSIVRWTILGLRWPQLACRVAEQPRLLHDVRQDGAASLGDDLAPLAHDDDLARLLHQPVGGVTPDLERWVAAEFGPGTPGDVTAGAGAAADAAAADGASADDAASADAASAVGGVPTGGPAARSGSAPA